MRRALKILWHLCALLGVVSLVVAAWLAAQGIGTRNDPPAVEIALMRSARQFAIRSADRNRPNPILVTKGSVRAGMEHWADHCASCHGNDGSGNVTVGQALYPRAPDMRQPATQELTDGALFYIIENGIKLTGMPAWGTGSPEGEESSWHLVNFIRHLPQLTDDELAEMEGLNPRAPAEWQQLEEERRFLSGESDAPKAPATPSHDHKGGHE